MAHVAPQQEAGRVIWYGSANGRPRCVEQMAGTSVVTDVFSSSGTVFGGTGVV